MLQLVSRVDVAADELRALFNRGGNVLLHRERLRVLDLVLPNRVIEHLMPAHLFLSVLCVYRVV